MKTAGLVTTGLIIATLCGLLSGNAKAADLYVLIKIQDMDRSTVSQVMSVPELKEFEKTLLNEKKFFQDAVRNASKAWRDDDFNKGITFPAGRLVPRTLVGSPERFATKEKAEEQLNKYYEREAQKEARQQDKDKTKTTTKSKEEVEREKKKASEAGRAAELLKDKLAELIALKTGGTVPEAAVGEKKVDEKKVEEKKEGEKKPDERKLEEKAAPIKAAEKAL
jgi:hypothetical protein